MRAIPRLRDTINERSDMYKIDAEREAIRQIQIYLSELSYFYGDLPHLTVDGIFGEETAEAVRAFQGTVPRPAIFVEIVTEPNFPACATISASLS